MLYILMSCVLQTMFKTKEIRSLNQGNGAFHLVACQWHHIPYVSESLSSFQPHFYDILFNYIFQLDEGFQSLDICEETGPVSTKLHQRFQCFYWFNSPGLFILERSPLQIIQRLVKSSRADCNEGSGAEGNNSHDPMPEFPTALMK